MKNEKLKRMLLTMGMLVSFIGINNSSVLAGTDREFWNMSIRAYQQSSVLTTRNKENNSQYSWVKLTQMNGVGKVNVNFQGPTWHITSNTAITSGTNDNVWIKVPYRSDAGAYKGAPIFLGASNYYNTSGTGSISGWVDYE